jgi:sugar O-acyltransferase (sialic acid O-acetyltransferase NeuD family)
MLIIGAKGFAKEVLESLQNNYKLKDICFFDDISIDAHNKLYNIFRILRSENEVKEYYKNKKFQFTLGIGNPELRYKLYKKFVDIGGEFTTVIDSKANIGSYSVQIGLGSNILSNANISNSVLIGMGCIIYYNVNITHDCILGDFVEVSPSVNILGNAIVGEFTKIGANSTILPNIRIGKNVVIGAGSVVTKNIPDNSIAYGVPAKIVIK